MLFFTVSVTVNVRVPESCLLLESDRLFHFGGQPAIIHSFPAVEEKRKVNLLILLYVRASPT